MGIHLNDGAIAYSDPHGQFHIERYNAIAELIKKSGRRGHILDVGSAGGYGAYVLAPLVDKITVVDIDPAKIADARKNFPLANAEYVEGDVCALPFADNTFDLVAACELIEHLDKSQQEKMLGEIARVLKPGGKAIITTPERRRSPIHRAGIRYYQHKRELPLPELSRMISKDLTVVSLWGQDVGRKMFFRHIKKKILPVFGKKFDYAPVDFLPHQIDVTGKASYLMVVGEKIV
jgi:ubiquinone/menaquinone biosynthesis C-methylase UbiE